MMVLLVLVVVLGIFTLFYLRSKSVLLVSLSVIIRFAWLGRLSGDMKDYLLNWFDDIKINGGLRALGRATGNYNVLYETILALLTYVPVDAIISIKLVSIFFDYCLCYAVGKLVFMLTEDKEKAILASLVCIMHPVIFFNSAAWGQCDSIYVFWIILSIVYLLKNKYGYSFVCLGLAFSFKLQAVFILPFFLLYYVNKKDFSCLYFLIVPAVVFLSSLVGVAMGRGVFEFVKIYFRQTKQYPYITVGYPGFWTYFFNDNVVYEMKYIWLASAFAVVMVFIIGGYFINKVNLDNIGFIKLSFITTYSAVYFLPCMHERYSYLVVVLSLILAVIDKRTLWLFTLLSIVDISTTCRYLFGLINMQGLFTVLNTVCFVAYLKYFLSRPRLERVDNNLKESIE